MTSPTVVQLSLRYGAYIAAAVLVLGALVGFLVDGVPGALSALVGAALAAVFMGLTAASILVADRLSRGRSTSGLYFGIILATWLLKLAALIVVALIAGNQPWMNPYLFFGAVVVVVMGSLFADGLALQRARVPYTGDNLP